MTLAAVPNGGCMRTYSNDTTRQSDCVVAVSLTFYKNFASQWVQQIKRISQGQSVVCQKAISAYSEAEPFTAC